MIDKIENASAFQNALNQSRAMIFVNFQWSGQAKLSLAVLHEWVRVWNIWNPRINVPIYELDGDQITESHPWLKSIGETGGYGSLNWIERGQLKQRIPYVAGAGIEKISSITNSLWG